MRRWLYWTDTGARTIERISMDGHGRTSLHTTNLQTPYALAIDYATQTLYWADYALNKLESSGTDGSNRRLLNSNLRDPYAMTFFAGKLYWTDSSYNGIYSALANSPSRVTPFLHLSADPYGIQVYDEGAQFEGKMKWNTASYKSFQLAGMLQIISFHYCITATSPCADNCSQLCLLSATAPAGYSCACNGEYILNPSHADCERKAPQVS